MEFLKKFRQKSVADYQTIELEASNAKLQFDLVETLKARIHDLERENGLLRSLISEDRKPELGESSLLRSDPPPKAKRHVRSIGEVKRLLEEKSRQKISLGKEISEDEVTIGMP